MEKEGRKKKGSCLFFMPLPWKLKLKKKKERRNEGGKEGEGRGRKGIKYRSKLQ